VKEGTKEKREIYINKRKRKDKKKEKERRVL
jgi:hypothetical protein